MAHPPAHRAVETAALSSSVVTKLGMFLLSSGLYVLAERTGDTRQALQLLTQTQQKLDAAKLKALKINVRWVQVYPTAKIGQSFVGDIKKAITRNVVPDTAYSQEDIAFVRFAALFAENPDKNERYLSRARQHAGRVGPNFLRIFDTVARKFDTDAADPKRSGGSVETLYEALEAAVVGLLGRKAKAGQLTVPMDVVNAARLGTPAAMGAVKDYRAAQRKVSVKYDSEFALYIANQRKPVRVDEAYKAMAALGFRTQKIPNVGNKSIPLRVGHADGKIKYYTDSGKPLNTGIPANAIKITFARTYKEDTGTGAYLHYTTDGAIGLTRVYTEAHQKAATVSKFDKADMVAENIDRVITQWKRDLGSSDPMRKLAASAAFMIYLTGMRVGSRQNSAASATGEKTYGAISLRPRHIRVNAGSISFNYPGKKGVAQKHVIKLTGTPEKALAKNLEAFMTGKRGEDLVFSVPGKGRAAKPVVLTYSQFVAYLKTSGYPSGVHKLRHVRGTNLVVELLGKTKFSVSAKNMDNITRRQKEAEAWIIDKVLVPASQLLGHKSGDGKDLWRTTIKSYINPGPVAAWFDSQGLRKPKWLPAKVEAE